MTKNFLYQADAVSVLGSNVLYFKDFFDIQDNQKTLGGKNQGLIAKNN
jgi:hypothetical protein